MKVKKEMGKLGRYSKPRKDEIFEPYNKIEGQIIEQILQKETLIVTNSGNALCFGTRIYKDRESEHASWSH